MTPELFQAIAIWGPLALAAGMIVGYLNPLGRNRK